MAKKQYFSPDLEVNTLSQEDVLTASVEIEGYKHVYGTFSTNWLGGTMNGGSEE